MTTTHEPNITVSITLDPAPIQEAGFGVVLLLVAQATNSLNGVRMVTYTSYEDAVTDNTAGYISAATLAAVGVAFAQRPKPASFKVARVDLVGGETYATGLTAAIAFDSDFYGVCIDSRSQANMVLVSDLVEASSKKMLFCLQDDDASWLTAGIPAGLATIDGAERTIAAYHTADTEWMDVGILASRLAFDPDNISVPWHGFSVAGVDSYATEPTAAQRLLAIANNANLGLPYGGEDFVIDAGTNLNTRPIDEILTADWYATRLTEQTAAEVVAHGNRGEKIVVDKTGQRKVSAIAEGLGDQGIGAGHFVRVNDEGGPGFTVTPEAITSADRTARRFRTTIRGQYAVSGRIFTYTGNFSRDPISGAAE